MATEAIKAMPPASQPGRDRSPPFPFISLKGAIDRLTAFDATFGRHPAPMDKLGLAWKMKAKSSQALQTAAALRSFGLLVYQGPSDSRVAVVSDDGRTYLRAQQDSVKSEVLSRCALKPRAISMCWQRWGADRPPDPVCLDQLILKDKFTDSAARTLLRVYDETVAFARLANGAAAHESPVSGEEDDASQVDLHAHPKIGDLVTWESGGTIQFLDRRVLGLSPDGAFAFVEGSATGVPVKELTVTQQTDAVVAPHAPSIARNPFQSLPTVGLKQDTFTLDEGPVVLQWPSHLSKTSYEDFESWIQLQLRKIKRSIQ